VKDERHWEEHRGYKAADAPAAVAFAAPKAARIAALLDLRGDETILDVGAGTGHLTQAFRRRGHRVVALDAARALLRRNPADRRVRGDALRLPFADGAFALAVESNLLHHVDDPQAVLREMARVGSGRVAAIEPNRNHPPMFLFSLLVREEWPALRFTRTHLRRLAARAGLTARHVEATGWVYQNKTPGRIAGRLGKYNKACSLAAYILGVFDTEHDAEHGTR